MKYWTTIRCAYVALGILLNTSGLAHAESRKILRGHLPRIDATLVSSGRFSPTNQLDLAIGLPVRNPGALDDFLRDLYNPASTNFHRYLTPGQFTERFGPTTEDYQAVEEFAQRHGLIVTGKHSGRMLMEVTGTARDVENAFQVKLLTYNDPTEKRTFYAPDSEPSVPTDAPILDVSGLDSFSEAHPLLSKITPLDGSEHLPEYWTGDGPYATYIAEDFKAAYASDVSMDGMGQNVGLLEFDSFYPSDVRKYEITNSLPSPRLEQVLLPGATGTPGINNSEAALDAEMAVGMAPGISSIIAYEAPASGNYSSCFNSLLIRMAEDDAAKQLSSSWNPPKGSSLTRDQIYQQLAAQGQSFFQASGDDGAYTNGVRDEADNPYTTIVGGTGLYIELWGYSGGGIEYYFPVYGSEWVWNDGTSNSASGGGVTGVYPIPKWQQRIDMSANGGSTNWRNSPDVATLADGAFVCFGNGKTGAVGGTSVAAPLWAGFTALVNEQAALNGLPSVGFINPAIYAIGEGASYNSCFHDITSGDNTTALSPNEYYSQSGYDLCTGWGTPGGQALLDKLTVNRAIWTVSTTNGFAADGPVGGPFSSNGETIVITNNGSVSLHWIFTNIPPWLTASLESGDLNPNQSIAINISLNSVATNLGQGLYSATVVLVNQTGGSQQAMTFALNVDSGSLQVILGPAAAAAAGPQWQVDGGPWMNSGDVLTGLSATAHTVSFQTVPGWIAPSDQNVLISTDQTTTNYGMYAEAYSFTTIAGRSGTNGAADGTGGAALFSSPGGIALDGKGNVFVVDSGNDTIRELIPEGTNWSVATIAGLAGSPGSHDGTNSVARFNQPFGIAVDVSGHVYVGDSGNSSIRELDLVGTNWVVSTIYASPSPWPVLAVALDTYGNVYGAAAGPLASFNPSSYGWNVHTWYGTDFNRPLGLVITPQGARVSDASLDRIFGVTYINPLDYVATGVVGSGLPGATDGPAALAQFSSPAGIALDDAGNMYVADMGNHTIRKLMLSPSGTLDYDVVTIGGSATNFGSADGTNVEARFNSPAGITMDTNGVLYISDEGDNTIRMGKKLFPFLTVLANVSSVATEAAQFQIDGGAWYPIPSTIPVTSGTHTISFQPLGGWITPSNQTLVINADQSITGIYIRQVASLEIVLMPPAIVDVGAQWQLDGGEWEPSGAMLTGLQFGSHTLAFTNIPNWVSPTNQNVILEGTSNVLWLAYAPIITNTPSVSIVFPTAGEVLTNQTFSVSGVATDFFAVSSVWYQINGGAWAEAAGTNTWSAGPVSAPLGPVTAQVFAMDASGNFSTTNTVKFVFSPSAPLTVTITGAGAVTPKPNNYVLVGQKYRLTAAPSAGWLFSNWTGDFSASTPTITFTPQTNTTLQANFIPSPFAPIAGTYEGLFYNTNEATQPSSGLFIARVAASGVYSGTIETEEGSYPFSKQFTLDGQSSNYIARAVNPIAMQLTLDLSNGAGITGEFVTPNWSASLVAYRSPFSKSQPDPAAGRYTMGLLATKPSETYPAGGGHGVVTVNALGNVTFAGTLGDGTGVSQSAVLSEQGIWPFYVRLYSGQGVILGWLTFSNSSAGDIWGDLKWMARPLSGYPFYANGFSTTEEAIGSLYAFTNKQPVLNLTAGQISLSNGNLPAPFTNLILMGVNNVITNLSSNGLGISISTSSGVFHGSVIEPVTRRRIPFSGAILQKQQEGVGLFSGTNQTGEVLLSPSP